MAQLFQTDPFMAGEEAPDYEKLLNPGGISQEFR